MKQKNFFKVQQGTDNTLTMNITPTIIVNDKGNEESTYEAVLAITDCDDARTLIATFDEAQLAMFASQLSEIRRQLSELNA